MYKYIPNKLRIFMCLLLALDQLSDLSVFSEVSDFLLSYHVFFTPISS